jgi:hypothetical protein
MSGTNFVPDFAETANEIKTPIPAALVGPWSKA